VLTVTRDMILATTVTGSYPRSLWFDRGLDGRSFKAALGDSLFREQYLDAVTSIIVEQEAGGLDIVTDGDSRFDVTVGGKSWFFYLIERFGGIRRPSQHLARLDEPQRPAPGQDPVGSSAGL
jgi:5-methyltetrahydropteroyltriglutamate--homocysteine methyltransferase